MGGAHRRHDEEQHAAHAQLPPRQRDGGGAELDRAEQRGQRRRRAREHRGERHHRRRQGRRRLVRRRLLAAAAAAAAVKARVVEREDDLGVVDPPARLELLRRAAARVADQRSRARDQEVGEEQPRRDGAHPPLRSGGLLVAGEAERALRRGEGEGEDGEQLRREQQPLGRRAVARRLLEERRELAAALRARREHEERLARARAGERPQVAPREGVVAQRAVQRAQRRVLRRAPHLAVDLPRRQRLRGEARRVQHAARLVEVGDRPLRDEADARRVHLVRDQQRLRRRDPEVLERAAHLGERVVVVVVQEQHRLDALGGRARREREEDGDF